jgi:pyruvate kinase
MCRDPRPTTDEREDVMRLVASGVRGFLLTAETSVGRNPEASILALREILETSGRPARQAAKKAPPAPPPPPAGTDPLDLL